MCMEYRLKYLKIKCTDVLHLCSCRVYAKYVDVNLLKIRLQMIDIRLKRKSFPIKINMLS